MKKIILFLAVFAIVANAAASLRSELLKRLEKIQEKGIMLGHHDDPVYGTTWKWEEGRSDILETAGDYPAIMEFDLGGLELGWDKNLDKVPFERIHKEIVNHYERGGIVAISWHPFNPTNGKDAWFKPAGNAVTAILPGGALNPKFNKWLDKVASFIMSLKDKNGDVIPVLFRPWHEMNGGWFWWGASDCTLEEYRQLYQYTHKRISEKVCDNLVWGYSPNLASNESEENFMKYYPGDEYVDLIGIDVYQMAADSVYQGDLRKEFDVMKIVGEKHNKLVALTETGNKTVSHPKWFTETLLPVLEEYKLCYALLWRNAWDNPKEVYASAPNLPTAKDFKKFCKNKRILMNKDIKKMK